MTKYESELMAMGFNALIGLKAWSDRQCDLTIKKAHLAKQIADAQKAIDAWTRHNELRPGGQE